MSWLYSTQISQSKLTISPANKSACHTVIKAGRRNGRHVRDTGLACSPHLMVLEDQMRYKQGLGWSASGSQPGFDPPTAPPFPGVRVFIPERVYSVNVTHGRGKSQLFIRGCKQSHLPFSSQRNRTVLDTNKTNVPCGRREISQSCKISALESSLKTVPEYKAVPCWCEFFFPLHRQESLNTGVWAFLK